AEDPPCAFISWGIVGLAELTDAGHFTFSDFCEVPRDLLAFLGSFDEACQPRHLPWRRAHDIVKYLALNFFRRDAERRRRRAGAPRPAGRRRHRGSSGLAKVGSAAQRPSATPRTKSGWIAQRETSSASAATGGRCAGCAAASRMWRSRVASL